MGEEITGKSLQVLDLMLEFFADDDHWLRGLYHDGRGRAALSAQSVISQPTVGLPRRRCCHSWHPHCRSGSSV